MDYNNGNSFMNINRYRLTYRKVYSLKINPLKNTYFIYISAFNVSIEYANKFSANSIR